MGKIIILLAIVTAIGCVSSIEKRKLVMICTCEEQQRASLWAKEVIGPANNMSDEEMEDVIAQIEKTAIRLNCSKRMIDIIVNDAGSIQSAKLDSCQIIID